MADSPQDERDDEAVVAPEEVAAPDVPGATRDREAEPLPLPSAELKAIVEALIFASPDPLTPKALLKLLASEPSEDVLAAIEGDGVATNKQRSVSERRP